MLRDGYNNIYLAPMASYTNVAFRLLCQELGFKRTYTEYINRNKLFLQRSFISSDEKNIGIQLLGNDSYELKKLAIELLSKYENITEVNLNMGCPFDEMIGEKNGCALMAYEENCERIFYELANSINVPFTIKIRKAR